MCGQAGEQPRQQPPIRDKNLDWLYESRGLCDNAQDGLLILQSRRGRVEVRHDSMNHTVGAGIRCEPCHSVYGTRRTQRQ